nr:IS3 family transposase [Paenibacillus alvei]
MGDENILHCIYFHNTERYQWTLKKMTPNEYRNHLLTA